MPEAFFRGNENRSLAPMEQVPRCECQGGSERVPALPLSYLAAGFHNLARRRLIQRFPGLLQSGKRASDESSQVWIMPRQRKTPARWLIIFLLLLPIVAMAVDSAVPLKQLRYRKWTEMDGQSFSPVTAIAQTTNGYLWIGTTSGLYRFDGNRFVRFDLSNTPELKSALFSALCVSADALWAATADGLILRSNDAFHRIELGPHDARHRRISALACTDDGAVYAGTSEGLVVRVGPAPAFEKVAVWTSPTRQSRIQSLTVDATGRVVFYSMPDGLMRCGKGDCRRVELPESETNSYVAQLSALRNGDVWGGVQSAGIVVLRSDEARAESLEAVDPQLAPLTAPIFQDRSGSMWFSTHHNELARWSKGSLQVVPNMGSQTPIEARAFHEDREGNLWVGTNDGAVYQLLNPLLQNYGPGDGRSMQVPISIIQDNSGDMLVSYPSDGVYRLDGDRAQRLYPGLQALDNVHSLAQETDGTLWFGTRSGIYYAHAGEEPTRDVRPGAPQRVVLSLFLDALGRLWSAGGDQGIAMFDGQRWQSFGEAEGFTGEYALPFAQGERGEIWIGSFRNGLFRYADGEFTHFGEAQGLLDRYVTSIVADRSGQIWFGLGNGGLYAVDNGKVFSFGARAGIPADHLSSLLEDDYETLWIGTNKGVFRARLSQLRAVMRGELASATPERYDRHDGMESSQFVSSSQPVSWKATNGDLWFSTVGGVVQIDPAKAVRSTTAPKPILESVTVDGVEQPRLLPIDLAAGTKRIALSFTAIDLTSPLRVRFRYRLHGLDEDWIEIGARRSVELAGLSPGAYRFQLAASMENGPWYDEPAGLGFRIAPPWHRNPYLVGSLLVLAVGVVLALVYLRFDALRTRARTLHDRHRLARELHDTLAQSFSTSLIRLEVAESMAAKESEPLREQLRLAQHVARESLDEMRRVVSEYRNDVAETLDVSEVLYRRVQSRLSGTGVELHMDSYGEALMLGPVQLHQICRIVDEAVSNALMHGKAPRIDIRVDNTSDGLRVVVENAGGDNAPREPDPTRSHSGIQGMQERAQEIGGVLSAERIAAGGWKVALEIARSAACCRGR